MNVVKFPYNASRRAYCRKPRRSINGTPEERAAKAAATAAKSPAATVIAISRDVHPEIRAAQLREFERLVYELDPRLRPAVLSCLRNLADGGKANA